MYRRRPKTAVLRPTRHPVCGPYLPARAEVKTASTRGSEGGPRTAHTTRGWLGFAVVRYIRCPLLPAVHCRCPSLSAVRCPNPTVLGLCPLSQPHSAILSPLSSAVRLAHVVIIPPSSVISPLSAVLSWAVLGCPIPLSRCPILGCPGLSYPTVHCPILGCPGLSYPTFRCPILGCPGLSYPTVRCPILGCPGLSYPTVRCPILGCPGLPYPTVRYPILGCPGLSFPTVRCAILGCPGLSYPTVRCPESPSCPLSASAPQQPPRSTGESRVGYLSGSEPGGGGRTGSGSGSGSDPSSVHTAPDRSRLNTPPRRYLGTFTGLLSGRKPPPGLTNSVSSHSRSGREGMPPAGGRVGRGGGASC